MKPLDWIILVIVLLSVLQGLRRGLIVSLVSLVGFVAAIILAGRYWYVVMPVVTWFCSAVWLRQFVSYFLVALFVWLIFTLLAHLLRRSVRAIGLGWLDRLFGGIFGLLRGVLVVVIGFIIVAATMPSVLQSQNSRLAPLFLSAAQPVIRGTPSAAANRIFSGLQREFPASR
jgi:membrane protein required for colicin V production